MNRNKKLFHIFNYFLDDANCNLTYQNRAERLKNLDYFPGKSARLYEFTQSRYGSTVTKSWFKKLQSLEILNFKFIDLREFLLKNLARVNSQIFFTIKMF